MHCNTVQLPNFKNYMSKERTKKIMNLLDKGKSVRDISGRLGVSTKTIVKVRKYTISDLNTIVLFIGFTLIELTKMFLWKKF